MIFSLGSSLRGGQTVSESSDSTAGVHSSRSMGGAWPSGSTYWQHGRSYAALGSLEVLRGFTLVHFLIIVAVFILYCPVQYCIVHYSTGVLTGSGTVLY